MHALFGLDVDVFEDDILDGGFGEADDDAGPAAVDGFNVFDGDVVEVGGEALDGFGGDFTFGQGLWVVLADEDGGFDVFHGDVLEDDVGDVGSAVAVGLDAYALVGAFEVDAFRADVLCASGDFGADGEAVAVEKFAIGDGDVFAGGVGAGGVDHAGLDGDVVVADVGVDVVDDDVGGAEGVDGVGVGGVRVGEDADVADDDVVGVVGDDLPVGGVLDGKVFDFEVFGVVEDDEAGAGIFAAEKTGVFCAADGVPPGFAVAVDGAAAGEGDVFGVGAGEEGAVAGGAELDLPGVVAVVGRAKEGGAFGDVEGDVALEVEGGGDEGAAGEHNSSAAGFGAGIDGGLDGGCVLGDAVGLGAVGVGVADPEGGEGRKGGEEEGERGEALHGSLRAGCVLEGIVRESGRTTLGFVVVR